MSTSKKPMKRSVSSASLSSKGRKQPEVFKLSQVRQDVYRKAIVQGMLLVNSLAIRSDTYQLIFHKGSEACRTKIGCAGIDRNISSTKDTSDGGLGDVDVDVERGKHED